MEGYTLTTFQAAVQAILNAESSLVGQCSSEEDEFFDAISYSEEETAAVGSNYCFATIDPEILRSELVQISGTENPYPHPLEVEVALLEEDRAELGFNEI